MGPKTVVLTVFTVNCLIIPSASRILFGMTDAAQDALMDPSAITGWHFHVYFDEESRDKAWKLRELVEKHLKDKLTELGRFHEVGGFLKFFFRSKIYLDYFNNKFPKCIKTRKICKNQIFRK